MPLRHSKVENFCGSCPSAEGKEIVITNTSAKDIKKGVEKKLPTKKV